MKLGTSAARKTILCVKAGKTECSLWSRNPGPYDGWISLDTAGVRLWWPTSKKGYPAIWADRGWTSPLIGVEGVTMKEGQP